MRCDRCGRDAVHFQRYSGLHLCGEHLGVSLESRAKRMIRAGGWIRAGDRVAVGLSGGPASSSLLRFLSVNFGKRRDLSLVAITVDEGTTSGRGMDTARIGGIAERLGVAWIMAPVNGPGDPARVRDGMETPVSGHTRLLHGALSSLSSEVGATKLAIATSLDDDAEAVFLRVIRGEAARLPGLWGNDGGIPVIRPFSRVPEEELLLYARLNDIDYIPKEHSGSPGSLGDEAHRMLADYTSRHPSALFSLAHIGEALEEYGRSGMKGRLPSGGRKGEPGQAASPGQGGHDRVMARD
jgi:tRNA(Ile)-lysidine synthase TilS/MesJ